MGDAETGRMAAGAPAARQAALRVESLVLLAYIAFTAFVAFHHEPWRDEADPWLYVRDLGLSGVLSRTAYAGFPALWFLLLFPFVKLGLPYVTQAILHLVIASASAAVILFRAPFSRATRILLVASYYLAYEYSVIVRCYALGVLLVFLVADAWRDRLQRPVRYALLVALLANVTSQTAILAALLSVSFLLDTAREREASLRQRLLACWIFITLGVVVAFAQLRTPEDYNAPGIIRAWYPQNFLRVIGESFAPEFPLWVGLTVGVIALGAIAYSARRDPRLIAILAVMYAALGFITSFVWPGSLRHFGLLFMVALFVWWVTYERSRMAEGIVIATLALSCVTTVREAMADVQGVYSGARETALFIREHDLTRYPIAAHAHPPAEALLPYLPGKKFWYAGLEEYGSFMRWDVLHEKALRTSYPDAVAMVQRKFGGQPHLLLLNLEMPQPERIGYRLLYRSAEPYKYKDEQFWLYASQGVPAN